MCDGVCERETSKQQLTRKCWDLDDALEDAAADADVTGEGALLVHIGAGDGLLGGLEAQADGFVVAERFGALLGLGAQSLGAGATAVLLLEGPLALSVTRD